MKQTLITNSIGTLVESNLTIPAYQRDVAWKTKDQQLLIYSIFTGKAIPQIFLRKCGETRFEVVDGQQRLESISRFFNNEIPVGQGPFRNSEGEIEYRDLMIDIDEDEPMNITGLTYKELPKVLQSMFKRYNMSVVEMTDCTTVEAMQWFLLINNQAKKLNPVEMRGALGGNIPAIAKRLAGSGKRNKAHPFFGYCKYTNTGMAHTGSMYQALLLAHTNSPTSLTRADIDSFVTEQSKLHKDSETVQGTIRVLDYMAEAFELLVDEDEDDNAYTNKKRQVNGLKKTVTPPLFSALHTLLEVEGKIIPTAKFTDWWCQFVDRVEQESADTQSYRDASARQTDQGGSVTERVNFIYDELQAIAKGKKTASVKKAEDTEVVA